MVRSRVVRRSEPFIERILRNASLNIVDALPLSGARGFDNVAGMLKWLDKYPYGCLEQTTSRALPLVYLNDLAKLAGLEEEKRITDRVQEAADRVLDMQRPDGGFGMWSSSYNDDADKFLQV